MQVYNINQELENQLPSLPFFSLEQTSKDIIEEINKYNQANEDFISYCGEWIKENLPSKVDQYTGEVVKFPHADGYAVYVVINLTTFPCLLHMPIGDAWDSPLAYHVDPKVLIEDIEDRWKIKEFKRMENF